MLEFVNRTLSEPECATLESIAIVESAEESAFHCTSEPDSKSSLNHVPGKRPAPESATDWEPPGALSLSVSEALSNPAVAGSKPIVTEQLAPIASVVGTVVTLDEVPRVRARDADAGDRQRPAARVGDRHRLLAALRPDGLRAEEQRARRNAHLRVG